MEFNYTIRRSLKRKKLTITVERDCSITVHAPSSITDDTIHTIVEKKRQWIYKKIKHHQKYKSLVPPGKELVNGESALYLGCQYKIEITKNNAENIQFEENFFIPSHLMNTRKNVLREWYTNKAKEKILPRAKQIAKQLGVTYNESKIVDNRYRWGSCTPNNNITFNWRLIKAPIYIIDYVIVHELTHMLEENHTDRFWNIVETHSPKMNKAREWLIENGQILEEDI